MNQKQKIIIVVYFLLSGISFIFLSLKNDYHQKNNLLLKKQKEEIIDKEADNEERQKSFLFLFRTILIIFIFVVLLIIIWALYQDRQELKAKKEQQETNAEIPLNEIINNSKQPNDNINIDKKQPELNVNNSQENYEDYVCGLKIDDSDPKNIKINVFSYEKWDDKDAETFFEKL